MTIRPVSSVVSGRRMSTRKSWRQAGYVVLLACLGGCGGSDRADGTALVPQGAPRASDLVAPSTSPAATTKASLREQIEALERSGHAPRLDRSSDVAGPDSNHNGVRDDIEAYLLALPLTQPQRSAAMQSARALHATLLVDTTDKTALQQAGETMMASTNCIIDRLGSDGYWLDEKIEAMTANTRARMRRYMQYNAARGGSVTRLPNHDTCEAE